MLGLNKDADVMRAPSTAFLRKSGFDEMFYHAHKRFDFSKKIEFKGEYSLPNKLHSFYSMLTGRKFLVDKVEDIHIQDIYFEKLFIMEILNAFYSLFSIIFAVAHYEITYESDHNHYDLYLYSCSFFSIFLIVNVILRERIKLEFFRNEKSVNEVNTVLVNYNKIKYLIQISFIIIHPNIFTKDIYYTSFNTQVRRDVTRPINRILLIIMLHRSYYILKLIVLSTKYMSPNMNRICRTFYFQTNIVFSIKSLIKTRPISTISIGLVYSVIVFAFIVRIFERDISQWSGSDFNLFSNSVWFICVTMTTVGFGDLNSKTNEGRIVSMIACISGLVLLSLLIIAVGTFLQMNSIEVNMFLIGEKCSINDKLQTNAKSVISNFCNFINKENNHEQKSSKPRIEKILKKNMNNINININTINFNNIHINENELKNDVYDGKLTKTINKNIHYFFKDYAKKIDTQIKTIMDNNHGNDNKKELRGIRNTLYKSADKLKFSLSDFRKSFNQTQNFSCENISFNILYNNFNCIFNELNKSLKSYTEQSDKTKDIYVKLKKIYQNLYSENLKQIKNTEMLSS